MQPRDYYALFTAVHITEVRLVTIGECQRHLVLRPLSSRPRRRDPEWSDVSLSPPTQGKTQPYEKVRVGNNGLKSNSTTPDAGKKGRPTVVLPVRVVHLRRRPHVTPTRLRMLRKHVTANVVKGRTYYGVYWGGVPEAVRGVMVVEVSVRWWWWW